MNTILDLIAAVDSLKIPWSNGPWGKGDEPTPPYINLKAGHGSSFGADNMTWVSTMAYDVEFYSHHRDYATESQIESALDAAGIYWQKGVYEIEDESVVETVYYVTVREN